MKLLTFLLLWLSVISYLPNSFAQNAYQYPRGVLEGDDPYYDDMPQKTPLIRSFYESTPPVVSLKKYAPLPKSQQQYGTCTGWAVAYAARTILEAQKNAWTDKQFITQQAFSPTFQYRLANQRSLNCSGAFTSQVVQSLQTVGSVLMKDFKNDNPLCPAMPINKIYYNQAKQHKIEEFTTLWASDYANKEAKIVKTKMSLNYNNPVVISMICPASFDGVTTDGLWRPTENPDDKLNGRKHGRHALCVVGYDDNKYGGAFEIQNSWGRQWGNQGYVWIRYEDFARFVYQAFELVNLATPTPTEPYLSGSLRLYDMDDKKNLAVKLEGATRNWNIVNPTADQTTYKVLPTLLSGSRMRMYLKSEQPAYVYMLGTGSVDKSVQTLLPLQGKSAAMNYTGSEIALPSEEAYLQMDNTTGKDYLILIYAKEKLDIESIRKQITTSSGTLANRVKSTLKPILIEAQYIDFTNDEIKFKVAQNSTHKKAFAMIITFNHATK